MRIHPENPIKTRGYGVLQGRPINSDVIVGFETKIRLQREVFRRGEGILLRYLLTLSPENTCLP
jgi:hypothetical protein